jgi:hypothetical protein
MLRIFLNYLVHTGVYFQFSSSNLIKIQALSNHKAIRKRLVPAEFK